MRILLDTNILIPMEDTDRVLDSKLADIKRLSGELHFDLFVHPLQREDINNDQDERRRDIVLSRIRQYSPIINPPKLSEREREEYGWRESSRNDTVDNALLYAIRQNVCHLLVTEDNGIHTKARSASIEDRVLRTDQFREFLFGLQPEAYISPSDIRSLHLYNLHLSDVFFDSLRKDYPDFDEWFANSARAGRQAWCIPTEFGGEELGAICIYKNEDNPHIADGVSPLDGKVLKLCTFKIAPEMRGKKLGERLLYVMFNYCVKHNIKYVYIHIWEEKNPLLVSLCEDFGFEKIGTYQGRDSVFLKKMLPEQNDFCSPAEYAKKYYPSYKSDASVKKYIIPIRPKYHEMLFFDIANYAHGFPFLPNKASANTIKKAYVCNAKIRAIKPGDIILFYRSHDRQSIQSVGVVEDVFVSTSYEDIMARISKRTALNSIEVKNQLKREALVIMFRLMKYLSHPITLQQLHEHQFKGNIQTIRRLPDEIFDKLINRLQ